MRRLAVIPLALLLGCWDFESLSGTYVPPVVDASTPGDIACAKTPNTLQEDCTKNGDINNNCLYGCDDPTCADHTECFLSKGYKGYGAVVDNANKCPTQNPTPIYQSLTTPTSCNGSCAPNSPNTTCTSALHVYNNQADCMGTKNETAKINLAEGNNQCQAVTSQKDSYYQVDTLKPGACSPKNATVDLTPVWGTNSILCDQSASKLVRFSDMQKNGVACVVFDGTDTSVCASTKVYPNGKVYYTGTTGASKCNCASAPTGNCTLTAGGNNLVNLIDKACNVANPTLSPIKDTTCMQALDAAKATFQSMGISTALVGPTCNATGTVAGTFAPSGGFTTCCSS